VVLREDDVLLREGTCCLLAEAEFDAVAQAGDSDDSLRNAFAHKRDVAVVDIQMRPERSEDGLRAALELRTRLSDMGILMLSQYYDHQYARDLIGESAEGVGYLLKERVGDVEAFQDPVARVAGGCSARDPEVVARMLGPRGRPLDELSPRERDGLSHLVEGKPNKGSRKRSL
jgi:DNA-binding NarL/FixJ family response regulator